MLRSCHRCGTLYPANKECPQHPKRKGSTRQWRDVRVVVLARDGFMCTWRLEDGSRCQTRNGLHVDHIVPAVDGGPNTPDNLRTLCTPHHKERHRSS